MEWDLVWKTRWGWIGIICMLLFLGTLLTWLLLRPPRDVPIQLSKSSALSSSRVPTLQRTPAWLEQLERIRSQTYATWDGQSLLREWPLLPVDHALAHMASLESNALWVIQACQRGEARTVTSLVSVLIQCADPVVTAKDESGYMVCPWYDVRTGAAVTALTHPILTMCHEAPSLECQAWLCQALLVYVASMRVLTDLTDVERENNRVIETWCNEECWKSVQALDTGLFRSALPGSSNTPIWQPHRFGAEEHPQLLDRGEYLHVVDNMLSLLVARRSPTMQLRVQSNKVLDWLSTTVLMPLGGSQSVVQNNNCTEGQTARSLENGGLNSHWSAANQSPYTPTTDPEQDAYLYWGQVWAQLVDGMYGQKRFLADRVFLPLVVDENGLSAPTLLPSGETERYVDPYSGVAKDLYALYGNRWLHNCAVAPIKSIVYFLSLASEWRSSAVYSELYDRLVFPMMMKHVIWDAVEPNGCDSLKGEFLSCQTLSMSKKRMGFRYSQYSDGLHAASTFQVLLALYREHMDVERGVQWGEWIQMLENMVAQDILSLTTMWPGNYRTGFELGHMGDVSPDICVSGSVRSSPVSADGPFTQNWPSLQAHLWLTAALRTSLYGVAAGDPWSAV
jgi:hypothetical protein